VRDQHVLLAERLEQAGPQQARLGRADPDAERERRQDQVLRPTASDRRQPAQPDREQPDEQQPEPEAGDRRADQ
jgi:hypothetical protein